MRNTRADVVAAALRVLHEHGLESLSMRRVAAELGLQPGALYHHVADKQSLLALMADEIVREVGGAHGAGDSRDSRASAAALCHRTRAALLAIRDGADVVATAAAYQLGSSGVEGELARLIGADGARTLMLFVFGHTQATQTRLSALQFGALPNLDAEEARIAADTSFERGIDIILNGIEH